MLILVGLASVYYVKKDYNKTSEKMVYESTSVARKAIDQELEEFSKLIHRTKADTSIAEMFPTIPENRYPAIFSTYPDFVSDGFDFPVGVPNARDYYKAQNFGDNRHLGEDWNGRGGGNTDLGDPVYSVANGLVTFSKDVCCGWGKTVRIVHHLPNHPENKYVESVYAHLHTMDITVGSLVKRGQRIGTIGNANGRYNAHLHLEMRNFINMSLGPGYGDDQFGYLIPTDFIRLNRPH